MPDRARRRGWRQRVPADAARHAIVALLCLAAAAAAPVAYKWTRPRIGEATYVFPEGPVLTAALPFTVPTGSDRIDISFSLERGKVGSTSFRVKPDGCIDRLTVNGLTVERRIAMFCDYSSGRAVDLANYLHEGRNDVRVLVRNLNGAGGLLFEPSSIDLLSMVIAGAFTASFAGFCIAASKIWWGQSFAWDIATAALAGSFLRAGYAFATPYTTRGHDTGAHVDYIRYVAEHMRIPPAASGPEFFQAPLYYTITGLYMRAASRAGHSLRLILQTTKGVSLALSIVSYLLALWIGAMLFDLKRERFQFFVYASVLGTMPSLVFLSSRISNEVLCQPLMVLSFGLLLFWWMSDDISRWYAAIVTIGVAILTKISAAVLVPVAFACLFVRHRSSLRATARPVLWSAAIVAVVVGGPLVARPRVQEGLDPVPSTRLVVFGAMDSRLGVKRTAATLLTFDPIAVINHPENDSWTDAQRRQFFWEYFFRSAFFGEFSFNPSFALLERLMLMLALASLPLIAIGVVDECRHPGRRTFPLYATGVVLMVSSFWYSIRIPAAPSQDFRYVTLLTVPLACAAIRGVSALRAPWHRIAEWVPAILAGVCALFLILLMFAS